MRNDKLGKLQAVVLEALRQLGTASALQILAEVEKTRKISISTLHTTLARMEDRYYCTSWPDNITPRLPGQQGRTRFLYHIDGKGRVALLLHNPFFDNEPTPPIARFCKACNSEHMHQLTACDWKCDDCGHAIQISAGQVTESQGIPAA